MSRATRRCVRIAIEPRPQGLPADLGRPQLPGCKSHAQRALLLAAFAPANSCLRGAPANDDVLVLGSVLAANGRHCTQQGDTLRVAGRPLGRGEAFTADVGQNGTAARSLLMLVPLLGGRLQIDGSLGLRRRPMGAAVQALRQALVRCDGERLPIVADGSDLEVNAQLDLRVDGGVTTQAATGALLAMAHRGGGSLRVRSPRARAYLDLTARVLRDFGCTVTVQAAGDDLQFTVGGEVHPAGEYVVPADASSRAFVAALASLHRRELPPELAAQAFAAHPDLQIDGDLARLQAAGSSELQFTALATHPDCVPALAAVAATRPGLTVFANLANLRHKESDRLAAMAAGLEAVGARAFCRGDDLHVVGPLRPGTNTPQAPTQADHRIVMALALLGTVHPSGVVVSEAEAAAKSWPGFFEWLARCALVRALD